MRRMQQRYGHGYREVKPSLWSRLTARRKRRRDTDPPPGSSN
jgi:hypothetical protein